MAKVFELNPSDETKELCRQEYLGSAFPNLVNISRKYGVSKNVLDTWKTDENWYGQRKEHRGLKYKELMLELGESPEEGAKANYRIASEIRQRISESLKNEPNISSIGLKRMIEITEQADRICERASKALGIGN